MTYLQVFSDYEPYMEPLDDGERGRLFTALMAYAFRGEETALSGGERILWPVFKRMVDQSRESLEKKQHAGRVRQQGAASRSTREQKEAERPIYQESRNKNQEQDQDQESGSLKHTEAEPCYDKDSARGGAGKPWYDPNDPDADCDESWRVSEKARAAIAQRIIDHVGLGPPGYADLHGMMCRLMKRGMHPAVTQECALRQDSQLNWARMLALYATRDQAWYSGLLDEEVGRFLPPTVRREGF